MTTFDDRKKAAENKYAHDEDKKFKIRARRNKLLGQEIAKKLGLKDFEANRYANDLVQVAVDKPLNEAVKAKIISDLNEAGIPINEDELRKEMDRLYEIAQEQLKNEVD